MDYIKPKTCSEISFRQMWDEFEWENRINATTPIQDLREYLDFLLATTNMHCLTPLSSLQGECGFLAANLYAQSIFGEDALANVCLESGPDGGGVIGHIRIRSKTQGIALALGEKVRFVLVVGIDLVDFVGTKESQGVYQEIKLRYS